MSESITTIRERLATYAHSTWSGWMEYMFEKSTQNPDGSVTIPFSLVQRWTRQMKTNYELLPEDEKKSDRVEADQILTIFQEVKNAES